MNNDDFRDLTRQFLSNVLEYADNTDETKGHVLNETLHGTQYRTLTVPQLQAEYPDAYVGALQALEFYHPGDTSETLEQDLISGSDKFVEDMADGGRLKWLGPTPWGGHTVVGNWSDDSQMWEMVDNAVEDETLIDILQPDGDLERVQRRVTH